MFSETKEIYEFGPYRLDVGQHKFERTDGTSNSPLSEKTFQTLVVLLRNQGQLVTKEELFSAVWPDTAVEENSLNKSIHAIRYALGEKPRDHKYIETVPKYGYRFIADARRIDTVNRPTTAQNGAAASIFDEQVSVSGNSIAAVSNRTIFQQSRPRWIYQTATAAGLTAALAIGGWLLISNWRMNELPLESASSNSEKLSAKDPITGEGRSPAYDLYVRGKVKVASENREDTEAAIKMLEEAVAIDPNFAGAFAQLARAYNTMAFKYSVDSDRKQFHENAEVALDKALALNPNLAEGHFARGLILWTNSKGFPHEKALQSYRRSLSIDPNSDEAHHQLSLVYSHIGLLSEAEQSLKKTLEINPNNTLARFRVGVYYQYQGRFDEALAVFKTIPHDTTPLLVDRSTAESLIQAGRLGEAETIVDDYLNRFPHDDGGSFTSVKALLLAKAGRRKEAEDAIERSIQIGKGFGHFHHTAYNLASAYAALNDPDEAAKWLEEAAENGFPNLPYFEIDPNLNNIRSSQRFVQLMEKLKPQLERYKALG